ALFGGGFRRGLPPEVEPWLDQAAPVLAVDVPSGLDPDTGEAPDGSFHADRTVTFEALKAGHLLGEGPQRCGTVVVAPIGLAEGEPVMGVAESADAPRPSRPRDAHKWSAGSVLVVGGSEGMVGAAVMAGRAALHFGAGAVGVASAQRDVVAGLAPELLTYSLDDLPAAIERYEVVVVGPGLGPRVDITARVLDSADHVVADADALADVAPLTKRRGGLVITPHIGEFRRLTDVTPGPEGAAALARQLDG